MCRPSCRAIPHLLSTEWCQGQAGGSKQPLPGCSHRLLFPRAEDFETGPSLSRPHCLVPCRPRRLAAGGCTTPQEHRAARGRQGQQGHCCGHVLLPAVPRPCWLPGLGPGMQEAKPCLTQQLSPVRRTAVRQASMTRHTRHSQQPANFPGLTPASRTAALGAP